MSEALGKILEALQAAGLSPDTEGTRDALWLSLQIAERESRPAEIPKRPSHDSVAPLPQSLDNGGGVPGESADAPPRSMEEARSERYGDSAHRLLRLSVPAPLPGSRTLGQALRPLRRKVSSPAGYHLDIGETVRQAAEEDIWFPVLRKQSERWLSMALVVEHSISMSVFHESVRELRRTFRYSGAFREIRVWWLDTEGEKARVYARHRDAVRGTRGRRLGEVPGSGRRTLVLVLSDCVSDGWYNGKILSVLTLWSRNTLVALLQVLPERMWPRTALGTASRVRLHASVELQTNSRLCWTSELPDSWEAAEGGGFLLPSASLDPASLHSLSQLVAGGSAWIPGFNFFPEQSEPVAAPKEWAVLGADERVRRFIAVSSAQAVKLATFLAVSPVVSMGVLRLLRRELLPEAGSVQEAEVLLGGLLRVSRAKHTESLDSEEVKIEFLQGVCSLLRDNASVGDVLRVVERAARFAQAPEVEASFIERVLVDPEAAAGQLGPESGLLAKEIANILGRLGGAYARISSSPEKKSMYGGTSRRRPGSVLPHAGNLTPSKGTILLADVDRNSLRVWGNVLRQEGYGVIQASSVAAAKRQFEQASFDLAVLESRLRNTWDSHDESGLELAEDYGHVVPIIILSGFRSVKSVRRVLERRDRRSAPAVAFVDKQDGPEALLRAIQEAIKPKVFISHGRDVVSMNEVIGFLRDIGARPVLLSEQPGASRTILEKLEAHSSVEFAIVLLTPDDEGAARGELFQSRARQDVIFELGFLLGKLGRRRVTVLKEGREEVELPSDLYGVLYHEMDGSGGWKVRIAEEMKEIDIRVEF